MDMHHTVYLYSFKKSDQGSNIAHDRPLQRTLNMSLAMSKIDFHIDVHRKTKTKTTHFQSCHPHRQTKSGVQIILSISLLPF